MPRQLTYRGSRLVYSYGIVSLAAVASILIVVFQASVTRLIPLYAIGVFLSFTLAQFGMARRWWRAGKLGKNEVGTDQKQYARHELHYEKNWLIKMLSNGFGALCTGFVMLIFAVTKFRDGAWVVLILTPILIGIFLWIHRHYTNVANSLSLDRYGEPPPYNIRHRVLVPISTVHQGTLAALRYARLLSEWLSAIGLDPRVYGTHSLRRTKATLIYRRTGNLRAVQLLLGHTKIESTVRYLGIDVDDALAISEQVEI